MAGISEAVDYVVEMFSGLMTRLIAAVIIILVGFIIARFLGKTYSGIINKYIIRNCNPIM